MFDFMFGWRKASKCKKLMKKLRCRLNLLKNKRCCIVKQLRNDVAQLIKHGHHQTAFNRVDQIYKDECTIAVYDLLAHFCEFLSLQLSYIRRSKDCPNDINEAISSLIFASARCGELPELLRIRKLFSQRYGERFEATALDLLPGNLVNYQIRENLSMNKVPNQVKSKLVEEITTSVLLQTGPLALQFTSQQGQTNSNDYIDLSPSQSNFDQVASYHQDRLITYHVEAESSSETIYHDNIKEFESSLKDSDHEKDQRVFMFTSFAGAANHKSINMLISIINKLAESMKLKRQLRKRPPQTILPPGRDISGLRAMSMPCNRREEEDGVMRCYSFPVQQCSRHVHPKLPDYDELAAKFMALKKEKVSKP